LNFEVIIFFTEHGHQSCMQPPTWRTRSLYLCPPVTGWPSYTPSHWVPFLSPSVTHRWRYSNLPPCCLKPGQHLGITTLCVNVTHWDVWGKILLSAFVL
jgi:hypothetical protein